MGNVCEQAIIHVPTRRCIRAGGHHTKILGYSSDWIERVPHEEYTHPNDLKRDIAAAGTLALSNGRITHLKRYIARDGTIIPMEMRMHRIDGCPDLMALEMLRAGGELHREICPLGWACRRCEGRMCCPEYNEKGEIAFALCRGFR